jgi:hypothetical protein
MQKLHIRVHADETAYGPRVITNEGPAILNNFLVYLKDACSVHIFSNEFKVLYNRRNCVGQQFTIVTIVF